jgi:hypothetical protein
LDQSWPWEKIECGEKVAGCKAWVMEAELTKPFTDCRGEIGCRNLIAELCSKQRFPLLGVRCNPLAGEIAMLDWGQPLARSPGIGCTTRALGSGAGLMA